MAASVVEVYDIIQLCTTVNMNVYCTASTLCGEVAVCYIFMLNYLLLKKTKIVVEIT